ncbi:MAG: hypothetical protein JXA37_14180 [Chloroflexia bacterium]|nr:hypothetical protein [Chloroflexia bacterium]
MSPRVILPSQCAHDEYGQLDSECGFLPGSHAYYQPNVEDCRALPALISGVHKRPDQEQDDSHAPHD